MVQVPILVSPRAIELAKLRKRAGGCPESKGKRGAQQMQHIEEYYMIEGRVVWQ